MLRIVVLDDDAYCLKAIRLVLESEGHLVQCVESPESFLKVAEDYRANLIILDVLLPQTSGLDLVQEVRNSELIGDTPILMISSLSEAPDRVRGLRSGANDYLTKPIDPEELLARVDLLVQAYAPNASFQGNLEENGLPHLLQFFSINPKSGSLIIKSGNKEGIIGLDPKGVCRASFENLSQTAALIALCELKSGKFSFSHDSENPQRNADEWSVGFNEFLMHLAWLEDTNRRNALPQALSSLSLVRTDQEITWSPALKKLPVQPILEQFENSTVQTLKSLQQEGITSRLQLDLTLTLLVRQNALKAYTNVND